MDHGRLRLRCVPYGVPLLWNTERMSYAVVLEQPIWYEPKNLLEAKLKRVGLDPADARWVYVFPEKERQPTLTKMKEQFPRVLEELKGVDAGLLLGKTPLQTVGGQTAVHTNRGTLKAVRKEMVELESVPFLVTLHPSNVLRTTNYTAGWVQDLAAFQQLVNPPVDNDTVILVQDANSWSQLMDAMKADVTRGALDIETTVAPNRS